MQAIKQYSKHLFLSMLFVLTAFVAGCGGGEGDPVLGQAASDTSPAPTVVAVAPLNGATNVALNTKSITAEFSISMDATTLTTTSFTLSKGNPAMFETEGNVTYINRVAELAITSDLDASTVYTATITTEAKSADGVALASNYVWTFTTAAAVILDTTPPTILSTSPVNGGVDVLVTKLITATFSEDMIASSITATVPSTMSLMETDTSLSVHGVATYSVINKIASFKPDVYLEPATNYTVKITTIAKDLAGNAMASDYSWTFTTAASIPVVIPPVVPVIPRVVAVAPEDNATNVSYNIQSITAEFSIPMDVTTLNQDTFTLLKGSSTVPEIQGSVTYLNEVAELAITSPLEANTIYTATITTEAKSSDGVALESDFIWTFTTAPILDTTPPTILSTSPIDGAIDVSITKTVTATFSEAMKSSSITTTGTFTLMETNSFAMVDGNVLYDVINNIASFNPTLDLAQDTNYTAVITAAAQDLAGNAMLLDYNWTFATAAIIPPPLPPAPLVDFGAASTYGIASTAGVTNTLTAPNTEIDGDTVLNPLDQCNAVTVDNVGGFGDCGGAAPTIYGTVVTPTYPDTTTAQAVTDDLRAAYLSIAPANMPGGTTIAAPTTLGAPTGSAPVEGDNLFYAGVYTAPSTIDIAGDLTLDAQDNENATFVFQAGSALTTAANTRILLINGAKASNVYWQVGSSATLGTATEWNGNILAYASITMVTGASSCGRLFAGAFTDGAFVFDSNKVAVPGNTTVLPLCQ